MPNDENHSHFLKVPGHIYGSKSSREISGHEPAKKYLKGCYTLMQREKAIGRFAFYINPNLRYNAKKTAAFGSFECLPKAEYSTLILNKVIELSKAENAEFILGPMEGSTWESHRFSRDFKQGIFMSEPFHHEYYLDQLEAFGFKKVGTYHSYLDHTLNYDKDAITAYETHLKSKGATIRNLDKSQLDEELHKLGELSIEAFKNNFLYTPISVSEFITKYKQLLSHMSEEFIWLIENADGELQAFMFAFKDLLDQNMDTLILKTLARKQESEFKEIAKFLAGKLNQKAKKSGFKNIIHAFMYNKNNSLLISNELGTKHYKSHYLLGLEL